MPSAATGRLEVRLSPEEKDLLARAAQFEGVKLSQFVLAPALKVVADAEQIATTARLEGRGRVVGFKKYTLEELLAACREGAVDSQEAIEWERMPAVGREWPNSGWDEAAECGLTGESLDKRRKPKKR